MVGLEYRGISIEAWAWGAVLFCLFVGMLIQGREDGTAGDRAMEIEPNRKRGQVKIGGKN